ncbi:MAG: hypothetical protein MHM6MM_004616 [Cercozoa sp. M6MM]
MISELEGQVHRRRWTASEMQQQRVADTSTVAERRTFASIETSIQFVELYNDRLIDLLHEDLPVIPAGSWRNKLAAASELGRIRLRDDRLARRAVASTLMNSSSSRSHTLLIVETTQSWRVLRRFVLDSKREPAEEGSEDATWTPVAMDNDNVEYEFSEAVESYDEEELQVQTTGTLTIVDLAGSERQRQTGNSATRLKESSSINRALSALGNVVRELSKQGGRGRHIPFRNCKLTRLLQASLTGNALCKIFFCVSPCMSDRHETMRVLDFASRCMRVKPTVVHENAVQVQIVSQYRATAAVSSTKQQEEVDADEAVLHSASCESSCVSSSSSSARILAPVLKAVSDRYEELRKLNSIRTALKQEIVALKQNRGGRKGATGRAIRERQQQLRECDEHLKRTDTAIWGLLQTSSAALERTNWQLAEEQEVAAARKRIAQLEATLREIRQQQLPAGTNKVNATTNQSATASQRLGERPTQLQEHASEPERLKTAESTTAESSLSSTIQGRMRPIRAHLRDLVETQKPDEFRRTTASADMYKTFHNNAN